MSAADSIEIVTLKRGTRLFHGTDQARFKTLRGELAFLTLSLKTAIFYASQKTGESGEPVRLVEFALKRDARLPAHRWIPTLHDFGAELAGLRDSRDWDKELFEERKRLGRQISPSRVYSFNAARSFCKHGFNGYYWDQGKESEIAICEPATMLRYVGECGHTELET